MNREIELVGDEHDIIATMLDMREQGLPFFALSPEMSRDGMFDVVCISSRALIEAWQEAAAIKTVPMLSSLLVMVRERDVELVKLISRAPVEMS